MLGVYICASCYNDLYHYYRDIYEKFIVSFEIEFDTNLMENMQCIYDIIDSIIAQAEDVDFEYIIEQGYKETIDLVKKVVKEFKEFGDKIE